MVLVGFCLFEWFGDEFFSWWYVQHMLPHGTDISLYAFIQYLAGAGGASKYIIFVYSYAIQAIIGWLLKVVCPLICFRVNACDT